MQTDTRLLVNSRSFLFFLPALGRHWSHLERISLPQQSVTTAPGCEPEAQSYGFPCTRTLHQPVFSFAPVFTNSLHDHPFTLEAASHLVSNFTSYLCLLSSGLKGIERKEHLNWPTAPFQPRRQASLLTAVCSMSCKQSHIFSYKTV